MRKKLQVPKSPICCHGIDRLVSVCVREAFLLELGLWLSALDPTMLRFEGGSTGIKPRR